jgi:outer membrane cobalamin receptor
LNLIPSVSAYGAAGTGMVPSIFIQGAGSDHTQFYWNGFLLNDPSLGSGGFDSTLLQVLFSSSVIESVEVYAGAQGVDYGDGAMGGVVLLNSSTSPKNQISFHQNYFKDLYIKNAQGHSEIFQGSLASDSYSWNFVLSSQRNEGISSAAPTPYDLSLNSSVMGNKYYSALNQFESDSDEKKMLLFDYQFKNNNEPLKIRTMVLYSHLQSTLDASESAVGDDPNAKTKKDFYQLGLGTDYQWSFEQKISATVSWVQTERADTNDVDSGSPVSNQSANLWQDNTYQGQSQIFKIDHIFENELLKNKLGFSKKMDDADIKENFGYGESSIREKQSHSDLYLKPELKINNEQTVASGVRKLCGNSGINFNTNDCVSVYELDWNYLDKANTGYFARWGQAIKTPTLFQLYLTPSQRIIFYFFIG